MSDDSLPRPYEYRRHGIIVLPGIEWEEWEELWSGLEQTHQSINFFVGDTLLAGQREFGERFSQVVDAKYLEQQKGPMWVCSKIPLPRRRKDLSYSYHRVIAGLPTEAEQDRWLDLGEPERWTVKRLNEELEAERQRREGYPSNGAPPDDDEMPEEDDESRFHVEPDPNTFGDPIDIEGAAEGAAEPPQAGQAGQDRDMSRDVPPPPQGDEADYIRSLIAQIRRLAPDLSPAWRVEGFLVNGGENTVKLTKGAQLAIGQGPSLPCALLEAALSALLSDLGAG